MSGGVGNGNGVVPGSLGRYATTTTNRLMENPNKDHKPESYDDLHLDFSPLLFKSLEQYLPPQMLGVSRDSKLHYMRDILLRYSPEGERIRVQRHREYKQRIISNYQPLHRQLYIMQAENFFVPSFLKAIKEKSFRNIVTELTQGVYAFEMLQPRFCELLLSEEILDYSHVPGRAVLHRGRHRHGARATTAGHRVNLLLWCRRYLSPANFFPTEM